MLTYSIRIERWRLAEPFITARERLDFLPLVHLTITHDGCTGQAEAAGVDYRGETVERIAREIEAYLAMQPAPPDRTRLLRDLPPGGARNAIDCALWDLEAKRTGHAAFRAAGLAELNRLATVYTLSLGDPGAMATAALAAPEGAILKLKLGGLDGHDLARVSAVRAVAPHRRLIADINEGWDLEHLNRLSGPMADVGVEMIEQPLPAGDDEALADYSGPLPLCADESVNTVDDLRDLACYDLVNIKLDKSGGLTAALELAQAALAGRKRLMVGSMLGTSLGMAPAFLVGQHCTYIDLDGPLLLAEDRVPPMVFAGATVYPPSTDLWG